MGSTKSALTLGMHHSCFCHGLRAFFSGAAAPSRGPVRAPTPTPPPSLPAGAGSNGHASAGEPDCRPARCGGLRPGRPASGTDGPGCRSCSTPANPSSAKRRLMRNTVPSATSRAWATWGADQPASVFSKIRARVVTRAVHLPARTRCSSWFRCSGVNRTPYFSLTTSLQPFAESGQLFWSIFHITI